MTQTHTPGPWRVFDAFTDIEIVTDRPTAHETESLVQFKGQRNAKANARVMAAGAEMLEALEFCDMTLADLECSKRKGYIGHAIKLTRDAIAKAKPTTA